MAREVYLDYHTAKPVDQRVIEQMMPWFTEKFGNPSSLHKVGDVATETLEESRKKVAEFVNADPDEILFTSGATEAINLGIIGYLMKNKRKGNHLIMSEVEHISIHNIAKYLERLGMVVSKVPVDQYGRVSLAKLERRITDKTILISIQTANNEIGTIQDIKGIGHLAQEKGIAFHTDAVAAEGLVDLDVKRDQIGLMSLSSNDVYGPRGVGALVMRKGFRVNPIIYGGGQERGLRSGSEDIPSIVGMAAATGIMRKEMASEIKRFRAYRERLFKVVLETVPDSYLNGHPTERLASNAHFRFDGVEGEALLLSFKDKDISVSTGSACTSKTLEPSHTLISTGLIHEEAHGSLQLTTGRYTEDEDIDIVLQAIPEVLKRLRDMSPVYKPKNR